MPIARVQMPDGRVARFEVPEGTTQEEIEKFAETQTTYESPQSAGAVPGVLPNLLANTPLRSLLATGKEDAIGLGRGFMERIQGAKQFYLERTDPEAAKKYTKDVEEEVKLYEKLEKQNPRLAGWRMAGDVAATTPFMYLPGGQGRTAARMANAVTQGLIAGGGSFVPEGGSRAENALTSGGVAFGLSGIPTFLGMAIRGGARGSSGKIMRENIELFKEQGFPYSAGLTGGGGAPAAESLIARSPGGVTPLVEFGHNLQRQMGKKAVQIAEGISLTGASDEAGAIIKKGIEGYKEKLLSGWEKYITRLDKIIKPDAPVTVTNTSMMLDKLRDTKGSSFLQVLKENPKLEKLLQGLSDDVSKTGAIRYDAAKEARSFIGAKLSDASIADDINKGQWKALYGALSQDIGGTVYKHGDKAKLIWDQSSKFYAQGMSRLDDVLIPIFKQQTPEKAFEAVMRGAKQGPSLIRTLRGALSKDEWRDVQAVFVRRLGEAKPGHQLQGETVFSSSEFLTNWSALKDSQKLMFGGHNKQLIADLNKLARTASQIRRIETYANPPKTGMALGAIATTGMLIGGAGGAAIAASQGEDVKLGTVYGVLTYIGTMRLGASLMTKPSFVNWLAKTTQAPKALPAHLSRLHAAIKKETNEEDKQAMQEVANYLEGQK